MKLETKPRDWALHRTGPDLLHTILTLLVEAAKLLAMFAVLKAVERVLPWARRPARVPLRTPDTPTRITAPVITVLMYTVLIVTNPPWMEMIDRAWFVDPATGIAMAGWLAAGVTAAAGWKQGLLVGLVATTFGLLAMWGDTLHGYVSFSTPFYDGQVAAMVGYGVALAALYQRASEDGVSLTAG